MSNRNLVAAIVDGVLGGSAPAGVTANASRAEIEANFKAAITAALQNNPDLRRLKESIDRLAATSPQALNHAVATTNAADQERADLVTKIVGAGVFSKEVAEALPLAALKQLTANAALMSGHPVINRDLVGSVADNYRSAALPGEEVAQWSAPASMLGGSSDAGSFLANLKSAGGDK